MSIKIYGYNRCSTCRKACKFLEEKGVKFENIAIREQVPTLEELELMLKSYDGQIKKLFNTSGVTYRELKLKDVLPSLSEQEALKLLQSDGNLIKRPFLIGNSIATVGFKEELWTTLSF